MPVPVPPVPAQAGRNRPRTPCHVPQVAPDVTGPDRGDSCLISAAARTEAIAASSQSRGRCPDRGLAPSLSSPPPATAAAASGDAALSLCGLSDRAVSISIALRPHRLILASCVWPHGRRPLGPLAAAAAGSAPISRPGPSRPEHIRPGPPGVPGQVPNQGMRVMRAAWSAALIRV